MCSSRGCPVKCVLDWPLWIGPLLARHDALLRAFLWTASPLYLVLATRVAAYWTYGVFAISYCLDGHTPVYCLAMYIERSSKGAKDPHGSFTRSRLR